MSAMNTREWDRRDRILRLELFHRWEYAERKESKTCRQCPDLVNTRRMVMADKVPDRSWAEIKVLYSFLPDQVAINLDANYPTHSSRPKAPCNLNQLPTDLPIHFSDNQMTQPDKPLYTKLHWAKADPNDHRDIHLLEHHLADVGACFERLLQQPTIRRRLAHSGGREDLDPITIARLSVFAALHDIGKVNAGFQTRIWRPQDCLGGRRPPSFGGVGHIQDLTPVVNGQDAHWLFPALGFEEMRQWDDRDGMTVGNLFIAALSHHGQPLYLRDGLPANTPAWQPYGELNPQKCTERIGKLVRRWFPEAFAAGGPPLPYQADFQHHFLGLCILADWTGSNKQFFPFVNGPDENYIHTARSQAARAIADIGLDIAKQRETFGIRPPRLEFADLFDFPSPNAVQQAAQDAPLDCPLVIIESETGSGKTEAALWRFARIYQEGLVDGLYFALPTRAAASQIYERVRRFVARLFPEELRPAVVLAVPGYLDRNSPGGGLQDYPVWWESHDGEKPWVAERAKRYLAAQIAVGTVDQALLGALQVRHAHLRASCLARNLLVVDEVHASDTYMREILAALLDAHRAAGGCALLMSATLGSASRQRWLAGNAANAGAAMPLSTAIAADYPAISWTSGDGARMDATGDNDQAKTVAMEAWAAMQDFEPLAARALAAARRGAKVLVIRNTVGYARSTQQALEALAGGDAGLLFRVRGAPTLHHGRFAAVDRSLLDRGVKWQLGKGKDRPAGGCIVVGTQTLEKSLDIDADLLIADLCPVDVLLQRMGRLHRHPGHSRPAGYADPQCVVLTPGADLSPLLSEESKEKANGLGPYGGVYRTLHILEATRRLIEEYQAWRIPEMNRELVERATHTAALKKITEELESTEGVKEKWREHAIDLDGVSIADALQADRGIIRRDKSFLEDNRDVVFPGRDEKNIRTRLGDDQVEVSFDPPAASPFTGDISIDRLTLPVRWLDSAGVPGAVTPAPIEGGFEFEVGSRKFRYDRLGVRPA